MKRLLAILLITSFLCLQFNLQKANAQAQLIVPFLEDLLVSTGINVAGNALLEHIARDLWYNKGLALEGGLSELSVEDVINKGYIPPAGTNKVYRINKASLLSAIITSITGIGATYAINYITKDSVPNDSSLVITALEGTLVNEFHGVSYTDNMYRLDINNFRDGSLYKVYGNYTLGQHGYVFVTFAWTDTNTGNDYLIDHSLLRNNSYTTYRDSNGGVNENLIFDDTGKSIVNVPYCYFRYDLSTKRWYYGYNKDNLNYYIEETSGNPITSIYIKPLPYSYGVNSADFNLYFNKFDGAVSYQVTGTVDITKSTPQIDLAGLSNANNSDKVVYFYVNDNGTPDTLDDQVSYQTGESDSLPDVTTPDTNTGLLRTLVSIFTEPKTLIDKLFIPTVSITDILSEIKSVALSKAPFAWFSAWSNAYNQSYSGDDLRIGWQAGLQENQRVDLVVTSNDVVDVRNITSVILLSIAVWYAYCEVRRWLG